jgi:poly(3-hydroxybutyrate) depolymerase
MNNSLVLLLLFFVTQALVCSKLNSLVPGQNQLILDDRLYYLYLPLAYFNLTQSNPLDIYYILHAANDNCEIFPRASGLEYYSEKYGYIIVSPCSLASPLFGTAWNAGTCCYYSNSTLPNDMQFLYNLYHHVDTIISAQHTLRYRNLLGYYDGAMLAQGFSCYYSHLFNSVISIAGVVALQPGGSLGLQVCNKLYSSAVSLLLIHGAFDPFVSLSGDVSTNLVSVKDNVSSWLSRNDCSSKSQNLTNLGPYSIHSWEKCVNNTKIEFVLNSQGGHSYYRDEYFDTTRYSLLFAQTIGEE